MGCLQQILSQGSGKPAEEEKKDTKNRIFGMKDTKQTASSKHNMNHVHMNPQRLR